MILRLRIVVFCLFLTVGTISANNALATVANTKEKPKISIEEIDKRLEEGLGEFKGPVQAEDLDDGRLRRLLKEVEYTDVFGRKWPVPAGTEWDGASIPSALWSSGKSPFVGKHRNAALVHDFYCANRVRSDSDTHLVFYELMRHSGTDRKSAITMYEAVARFGPRWQTEVEIASVGARGWWGKTKDWFGHTVGGRSIGKKMPTPIKTRESYCEYDFDERELERIISALEADEIDQDEAVKRLDELAATSEAVCEKSPWK